MSCAAGHASRGWIVGGALVGGTTYGLTRAQLDARQVELWQQGIEALDCARRASLPLDIGAEQQASIRNAQRGLIEARDVVQSQASKISAEVDRIGRGHVPKVDLVDKAVRGSAAAVADAARANAAALTMLNAARGRELSSVVDRIGAQVLRATESVAIDVSSVKALVGGIGGFASIFVPGIDATLGQAFVAYQVKQAGGKVGPEAGKERADTSVLDAAMEQLAVDMQTIASRQAALLALIASVDTTALSDALKGCNVTGVSTALVLQPASLEFTEKKADGKGVSISGGTPPYEVSLLDPVAGDAVAVAFSGGLSDRLQVKVTASVAAGAYTVVVKDNAATRHVLALPAIVTPAPASAPPPPSPPAPRTNSPSASSSAVPLSSTGKKVQVVVKAPPSAAIKPSDSASAVTVSPTPPIPTGGASAPVPSTTQMLWAKLATAMRAATPFPFAGSTLTVTEVKEAGPSEAKPAGGLKITLDCSAPIDPGPPTQIAIRNALSRVDTLTFVQLQMAGAIDRPAASQLMLHPTPRCLK